MATHSSLDTVCDRQQAAVLAAYADEIASTFDVPFRFWIERDGQWAVATFDGQLQFDLPDLSPAADPRRHLDGLRADRNANLAEPQLIRISQSKHWLFIPVLQGTRPVAYAVAQLRHERSSLYLRMAKLLLRNIIQHEQIERLLDETDEFARQVTDNFEELVFLREMARHLEVVELTKDALQMAETVLPPLTNSIKAQSLVLLAGDTLAGEGDRGRQVPASGKVALWHGPRVISDEACWELVQRYGVESLQQPVVKNHVHESADAGQFPELRSFILVAMVRNGRINNWLLALNRVPDTEFGYPSYQGNSEFGTGEATLLSSAASMLVTHASNVELFREKEKLLIDVVRVLVYAIEAKDEYTCGHSERVALFAKRLGQKLGLDEEECERLYLTGLLHDVGKIGVSDATLRKPGHLTDEEFEEIKKHPESGWAILHELEHLRYTLAGVLFHHERYDGKGYPDGLAGDAIPLEGRILAIADAYDAMTSDRPYRKGMPQEKAETILRSGIGTQWDQEMIDAFFDVMPDIVKIRETHRPRRPRSRRPGTIEAIIPPTDEADASGIENAPPSSSDVGEASRTLILTGPPVSLELANTNVSPA